jgi:hypothetical protein
LIEPKSRCECCFREISTKFPVNSLFRLWKTQKHWHLVRFWTAQFKFPEFFPAICKYPKFWRLNKDAEGRVHGHILADSTAEAADLRNRKSDEVT